MPHPSTTAQPLRVRFGTLLGFDPARRQKLERAGSKLADVLNSVEFRDAVLAMRFDGKPGFADDRRNPSQVYAAVLAAKERFTARADGEVDLNVELRTLSPKHDDVVGFTRDGSDRVTTNVRFFDRFDSSEVAGHLAHEWLHTLGFHHGTRATPARAHSVPYALGELVERLAGRRHLTPLPRFRERRLAKVRRE